MLCETGGTDEDILSRIRKAQTTSSIEVPVWKENVCPFVWLRNLEINKVADQEIADLYQQVFAENPEIILDSQRSF